jgi:hypothetical protein
MIESGLVLVKSPRVLLFWVAAALAPAALADQPAISAPALATAEATLDFCAQADPKSADRYWQQAKVLLQQLSEKTAAEVRKSDEYRQAYDSAAEMIGRVPQQDAIRACTESLAANR